MERRAVVAAVLVTLSASAAQAQLAAGARVRVWEVQRDVPPVELMGHVRALDARSITLDSALTLPWSSVSRIDVSAGPRTGPRWRSGLLGGIVGALGAGIAGVVIGDASHHNAAKLGMVGFSLGAAGGVVVGVASPGEQWVRVPLSTAPGTGPAPTR